jgi:8-oxo-dGTP pyrophosphatase MutT (NUDIX family)
MSAVYEKVTAFVVRRSEDGHDLLLFEHPSAGIQLPAGSVEPGEAARDAALREAREETGLADLAIRQELGHVDTALTDERRLIRTTTTVYARPTVQSFGWARLDRGLWVRCERRAEGFAQVNYAEWDHWERRAYISYQITGWVPETALAAVERRHFFLLTATGATAERWPVVDGVHRFILFWAPIAALPAIVPTQHAWLAMLPADLRH